MADKNFDVVLYGATGFVGRQTVRYFIRHAPAGLRWAVAGREALRLASLGADVPVLLADAEKQDEVDAIVRRTAVLLTTAGPFGKLGDPFVDACVRFGTDYIDISGETARIRDVIDRYHDLAKAARVRIVTMCGVSSAPADLGIFALDQLLDGRLCEARAYLQLGGGSFSGGSIASIAHAHQTGAVERERDVFLLNPGMSRPATAIEQDPRRVGYARDIGAWTSRSPMAISDTRAVRRSASICGRDIIFQEYMMFPGMAGLVKALGFTAVLGILDAIMRNRITRAWLARRIPPGAGPGEAAMDAGWYELRIVGKTVTGRTASIIVKGEGDAGNRVTVKCVCEGALALVTDRDSLPANFGVLTPGTAFGHGLIGRLQNVGVNFAAIER